MPDAAHKRGKGRWLGCLLVLVLILVVPVLALLAFAGPVQRWIVNSALATTLHAATEMETASLIGGIDIRGLRLAQPEADPDLAPAIAADALAVSYSLFPDDGRYVDALAVEDLRVALLRDAEGTRNFEFLIDFLRAPASDRDPMMLLPRRLTLAPASIQASAPGWALLLGGLEVHGTLDSVTESALRIAAPAVTGRWRLDGVVEESPLAGAVDLALDRKGGDITVQGNIRLDELASVDATAAIQLGASATAFDVEVREAAFTQALWGRLLRDLVGLPIQFDALDVSGAAFRGALVGDAPRLDAASLRGVAQGVVLGDDTQTYYQGDAVLALAGALGGAEDTFTAELELNPGGAVKVATSGPPEALHVTLESGTWEVEAMRAALPEAYREHLNLWPALAAIQLAGDAQRTGATVAGNLTLTPQLREAGGTAPEITGEWHVEMNEDDLAQSAYSGRLQAKADGSARVAFSGVGTALGATTIHLEKLPIGAWYRMWQGESLGAVDVTLTGDIQAGALTEDSLPIEVTLDGILRGVGAASLAAKLTGKATYAPTTATASQVGGTLDLGDLGMVLLKGAEIGTAPQKASGALSAEIDLDAAGAAFAMPELHGAMTASATLGWDGKKATLKTLTATGETLGYGDFFLPYGTESTLTGNLSYDSAARSAVVAPFDVELMAGTRIHADALNIALGEAPAISAGAMTIESDLALLVAREYLAGADATMSITLTDAGFSDGAMRAGVSTQLTAESLILPNTLSVLRGVDAQLTFAYKDGMDGGGTVAVEEVEVAGTKLRSLRSDVACEGESIILNSLRTTLFGGQVTATVAANLGSEQLQAEIEAAGEQIDLAVFTEEFEPPQVKLTGMVHGTVTATISPAGITAMEVDLESTEGFSLNREIVEDLLKSQEGGAMSDRVMNKVMKKMLGEEPQRPFDRAALTLNLQDDGRIGGQARLESSDLNLSVAIAADPEAVLAALRARQE